MLLPIGIALAVTAGSSSHTSEPAFTVVSQILETNGAALVTVKPTSATVVQSIRPLAQQRGVNLDGSLRSQPGLPMALQGNPFEDAWVGREHQGSMRLDIGTWDRQEIDIALPCKGRSNWIVGRTYNGRQQTSGGSSRDSDGYQGANWMQSSQPEILLYSSGGSPADNVLYLIYGADRYVEFARVNSTSNQYKAKNGAAGVFDYQSGSPDLWVYTDQVGTQFTFIGFNTGSHAQDGLLWKITDEDSNSSFVGDSASASTALAGNVGWDSAGRILTAYDSSDRRYTYAYTTLNSVVRLTQVKAETKTSGSWSSPSGVAEVARVDYDYYGNAESYGTTGDLKKATITTPLTDSGVSSTRRRYYRYWTATWSGGAPGYPHLLKYIYDPEGVRRYDWLDSNQDDDHLTANESDLASYAAAYFEYEQTTRRISNAYFNGECGCSGGVNGSYQFAYETMSYTNNVAGYDAASAMRTIVERPDATYLTQEFDEVGQAMDRTDSDIRPDTGSPKFWVSGVTRDANGVVTYLNTPENVSAYTHSTGAKTKDTSSGKVSKIPRTSSGDLTGFRTDRQYQKGTSGTLYFEATDTWTSYSKTITDAAVVRPLLASHRSYTINDSTTTTGSNLISYTYTRDGSTMQFTDLQIDYPAVTTGNNGSNSATHAYKHFRRDGLVDYEKDELGLVTYHVYTNKQETTRIVDAYTHSSDFSGITIPTTPENFDTNDSAALQQKTVMTYDAQGRPTKRTESYGSNAAYRTVPTYYSRLRDQRLVTLQYADFLAGSPDTYYGPVQYTVSNQAGKSEVTGLIGLSGNASTAALADHIDETDADPITAVDTGSTFGSLVRMSTSVYAHAGTELDESRAYFLIPGSGDGSAGTNYDATTYGYDTNGRRWRVKEPNGTIRRTVFDSHGRESESWMGTNDHSFSGGEVSTPDNMVKVESRVYDSGADKHNSLLTSITRYVEGSTTGQRVTTYLNDDRGRRIVELPPTAPYTLTKYDNLGRVVATGQYSSSSGLDAGDDPTSLATNRMALSESVYDEKGQVWKTTRHKIDQADGSDDDTLDSLTWYDPRGRAIKVRGEEYKKTNYDRLGRVTDEYVLAKDDDTSYSNLYDSTYLLTKVDGDIVLEQYETRYEASTGNVLMSVAIQRKHNDISGGETTGPLDTNDDASSHLPLKLTAADVKGRAQITANWYDQFGRQTDTVQYGTFNAADFDRSGLAVPTRSDTELRTTTAYNADGTVDTVTDPMALISKYVYDALGRRTKQVKNYLSGVNSGNPYGTDQNVTISYTYENGLRTLLTAVMPSGGGSDQVTRYIYGTTTGTPSVMKVSTGHLLRAVKYPDSTNSGTTQADIDLTPGTTDDDVVSYAYNAQGEEIYKMDQEGNVLESVYDDSGKRTIQKATTIISGYDDAVKRVESGYDGLGRTSSIVQYDATSSGSATDGVAYTYDDWGNVASYAEDRDSAVSGGGNQYTTSYTWTKNAPSYGRYTIRKTAMTMPDSRAIDYQYRSVGGLHDDESSRVSAVADGAVGLALYDYLGAGTVVQTKLYDISCMSRVYDNSLAYTDLDRFNRITTSRWTKDLSTDRDFYSVSLTYDRDSNITSAQDNVLGNYNGVGTRWDVKYTMDSVNRLTEAKEGTLSGGSIANTARDEQWTLSQTGNWDREKLDLNGDGDFVDSSELDDTRTHNVVNELTARDTDSNSSNNYTLAYDLAGNMTDDGKDYKYVYDVWGRLRKVKQTGNSALVAEYRYNGLNHRIGVHEDTDIDGDVDGSDKWYYDVFDERWRHLARYRESDTSPKEDFVPHQAGADGNGASSYIDLVICRNKDANTAWTTASDTTLEERTYLCQNWRADLSAMVDSAGMMKGWVKYSAYGTPFGLPAGDTDSDGACSVNERNQVQTWITNLVYDVRGDTDLDGDVDATDKTNVRTLYEGVTLGRGVLSASGVVNRKGYAGYEACSGLAGSKWLARNRVLCADLGRWISRDTDSSELHTSLYDYGGSRPISQEDPMGTTVVQVSTIGQPRGCPKPTVELAIALLAIPRLGQGYEIDIPEMLPNGSIVTTKEKISGWFIQRVTGWGHHAGEVHDQAGGCSTAELPWPEYNFDIEEALPIREGQHGTSDHLFGTESMPHTEGTFGQHHDGEVYAASPPLNDLIKSWNGPNGSFGPFWRPYSSGSSAGGGLGTSLGGAAHFQFSVTWECACGHGTASYHWDTYAAGVYNSGGGSL